MSIPDLPENGAPIKALSMKKPQLHTFCWDGICRALPPNREIFVGVQTFRRVPPVLPCNFCHPAGQYKVISLHCPNFSQNMIPQNCKNFLDLTMHDQDFEGITCDWTFCATSHGKLSKNYFFGWTRPRTLLGIFSLHRY